jgi:hypothetical protein
VIQEIRIFPKKTLAENHMFDIFRPLTQKFTSQKTPTPMKKTSFLQIFGAAAVAVFASAGIGRSALIYQDQFAVPPNTVGSTPSGWTSVQGNGTLGSVAASNLTYTDLAAGTAGSFGLNGLQSQTYRSSNFTAVGAGETIYYSFLFRLDNIGNISTTGSTSAIIGLSNNSATAPGNGVLVSSWGIRKDSTDATKFNLSVDGSFRGAANSGTQIIGLGAWAATGGTQFSQGTTYLLVASYTNGSSTSNFWVNPASSSFGGTAPTATATDSALAATGIQSIMAYSIMGTTNSSSTSWAVDAFRVGNTYADVTPVPEPATWVLLTASLCTVIFLRRRRRA